MTVDLRRPREDGADNRTLPTLGDFFEVRHLLAAFAKTRLEDFWAYMADRLPIEAVEQRARSDASALNAIFLGGVERPEVVALPGWNRPEGLGLSLVKTLGLGCPASEAVSEAAALLARDVVKLYSELAEDKWPDGIVALIEGYTWLMIGKLPAAS